MCLVANLLSPPFSFGTALHEAIFAQSVSGLKQGDGRGGDAVVWFGSRP